MLYRGGGQRGGRLGQKVVGGAQQEKRGREVGEIWGIMQHCTLFCNKKGTGTGKWKV